MKRINKSFFFVIGVVLWCFQAESQSLTETYFKKPAREISIIIAPEGYYPKHIPVFTNEKIKIYLTSTLPGHLSTCLMVPEKSLFMSVTKGKISEGTISFKKDGVYKFYCPTGKIEGKFIVYRKGLKKEVRANIGGKSYKKEWMPREK